MVPPPRIELEIYPYHGHVIPFNYRGFFELLTFKVNNSTIFQIIALIFSEI